MVPRIALYGLIAMLVNLSGWAIADRSIFLYQLWQTTKQTLSDPLLLDLRVLSALSALLLNFIPLGLAIGLYRRANWARNLTILLALCILIPSVLAELNVLRDPTPMKPYNWQIVGICTIVLLVLINPQVKSLFQRQRLNSQTEAN
jgi:uncharacterized protein involved in response to NO